MNLYNILSLIFSGMGVLIAYLAYKRGNDNRQIINKNIKNLEIIEEYLNTAVSISHSNIGGGWAGGTNINCTASNNSANVQQISFQEFKSAKFKENNVVER